MWVLASPVRTCVNISPHKLERKFSEHVSAMPALVFPQIYSKLVSSKMLAWIIYYYWYQPDQYRFNHTLCLLSFYLRHLMWIWFWNEDRRQISLFIICIECIMHLNQQAVYKKWKLCTKYNLYYIIHWHMVIPCTFKAFYTPWNSLFIYHPTDKPSGRHCQV